MKIIVIKKIAKAIYLEFKAESVKLVEYIIFESDFLYSMVQSEIDEDSFLESFTDEFSPDYKKLIAYILKDIELKLPSNRIQIDEQIDGFYISLSSVGKEINSICEKKYYEIFSKIEQLPKMKKGLIYEEFCKLFLIDIGLEAEITKASNDKGIDIIAKYKTNLSEKKSTLVFDDYVYLIGQAKFFTEKCDTPIIRRLVGDSLFIRFNQLEYLQLAHNAIHLIVFSHNGFTDQAIDFCKQNKIMRIETSQMITILSSKEKFLDNKTYMYLLQIKDS